MRLSLEHHPGGVSADGGDRVLYDMERNEAHAAPTAVPRPALLWTLSGADAPAGALLTADVELDPATSWLMRCDRVDFRPGGIAYRHTHPGPGIRFLLFGEITIETGGDAHTYGPGEAWFERGPDPVLATTAKDVPTAFARVLLLPVAYAGQRTIRYVDPADADKPKTQTATILLERPLTA